MINTAMFGANIPLGNDFYGYSQGLLDSGPAVGPQAYRDNYAAANRRFMESYAVRPDVLAVDRPNFEDLYTPGQFAADPTPQAGMTDAYGNSSGGGLMNAAGTALGVGLLGAGAYGLLPESMRNSIAIGLGDATAGTAAEGIIGRAPLTSGDVTFGGALAQPTAPPTAGTYVNAGGPTANAVPLPTGADMSSVQSAVQAGYGSPTVGEFGVTSAQSAANAGYGTSPLGEFGDAGGGPAVQGSVLESIFGPETAKALGYAGDVLSIAGLPLSIYSFAQDPSIVSGIGLAGSTASALGGAASLGLIGEGAGTAGGATVGGIGAGTLSGIGGAVAIPMLAMTLSDMFDKPSVGPSAHYNLGFDPDAGRFQQTSFGMDNGADGGLYGGVAAGIRQSGELARQAANDLLDLGYTYDPSVETGALGAAITSRPDLGPGSRSGVSWLQNMIASGALKPPEQLDPKAFGAILDRLSTQEREWWDKYYGDMRGIRVGNVQQAAASDRGLFGAAPDRLANARANNHLSPGEVAGVVGRAAPDAKARVLEGLVNANALNEQEAQGLLGALPQQGNGSYTGGFRLARLEPRADSPLVVQGIGRQFADGGGR